MSEEQDTVRRKKDESVKEGSDSDINSNKATKDRNHPDNFKSSDEDDKNCGPPSIASDKPADTLNNDILSSCPPQMLFSS